MGLSYRKRIKLTDNVYLNISKSGPSLSIKKGNLSLNSRGRVNIGLGNGNTLKIDKSGVKVVTNLKNKKSKNNKS